MTDSVQSLTRSECVARLACHDLGRVSVSVGALPVIVPVVYRVDGDDVLFSALLDDTIAANCDNAVIAFEVDERSEVSGSVWSVLVVGIASLLTRSTGRLSPGLADQAATDTRRRQLRLDLGQVSGLERTQVTSYAVA